MVPAEVGRYGHAAANNFVFFNCHVDFAAAAVAGDRIDLDTQGVFQETEDDVSRCSRCRWRHTLRVRLPCACPLPS